MAAVPVSQSLPLRSASCAPSAQKRKANLKNDKGLKWFKGTPKKSKFRLLKSAQQAPTPQIPAPAIAARVVEFDIEGRSDRLGVTEPLPIIEGSHIAELLVNINASELLPKASSPITPGRKSKVKSTKVKVKGKRNGKVTPNVAALDNTLKDPAEINTTLPLPEPSVRIIPLQGEEDEFIRPNSYIRYMEGNQEEIGDDVEYDLEDEDIHWLEMLNQKRKKQGVAAVKKRDMELLMDRLEKESYFQMQSAGMDHGPPIDDDAVCCICMDGECQNSNAILFCDMCNLAVHQDCYGVPYIPEGQWLCRKCLHSPSRAVECVLCPNKGGALKGTDDGRWAHVACAIWIPEVCFANTVFLEPIESIGNIPQARWRLTCFICKQKGIGACIQCYKSSCYTAFHVTCAQQANLVMKMETVRETHMTSVIIKKTAYCNNHAPPELLERKLKDGNDLASPRMKMKQTRKLLAEKRDALPVVLIPTIPRNRLAEISTSVNMPGRNFFMKRLMSYWKLKRQLRNGVPLLRRLQMASSAPSSRPSENDSRPRNESENPHKDNYRSWIRLRQDLEKARLLCELIRKREKFKRELIYAKVRVAEMQVFPMKAFFLSILEEISARDHKEVFMYPVDVEEVEDYLTMIKEPMDLSKMTEKVNQMEYKSLKELERDFNLMIENCLHYNDKDTMYYKTGARIRGQGSAIFRKAKKIYDSIGFDPETGLHLLSAPPLVSTVADDKSCKCNNSSNCNNNCKNNSTAPNMPASFTTYRSGRGAVVSESEDEQNSGNFVDGDGEESDSSYTSSVSSEDDEPEKGGATTRLAAAAEHQSASGSESSSDENSSSDVDENGICSEPEPPDASPAYPSHRFNFKSSAPLQNDRALRTKSGRQINHKPVVEVSSESESEESSSSASSSSSEKSSANNVRLKKIRS